MSLNTALNAFAQTAAPAACARYGNGHINETYLVTGQKGDRFILQKISRAAFPHPEWVIENISLVTAHIARKLQAAGRDVSRETLHLLPARDGTLFFTDEAGEVWRLLDFVRDSVTLESAEKDENFRQAGEAFGQFQQLLADFPAEQLHEVIARFHDTPNRFQNLLAAVRKDPLGRAETVRREIDFYRAREDFYGTFDRARAAGDLPLRVTHNDTKLNNILFDAHTKKPLCVIDLDTVMPGFSVNDFGDAIRFGASTAAEDEPDLARVHFSLPRYRVYAEGFLAGAGAGVTKAEKHLLPEGALMMTLECGMRFLTDYIEGDTYFHTTRAGQNLDRCHTHIRLVEEMEAALPAMRRAGDA